MKFTGYFLIVWDFIRAASQVGVSVGPGRGSAAGSIVAYALNITKIDPLKYNLLFERFLNPERVSMPDIDIDFNDETREKVIAYVKEKYGENAVAQIVTFGTLSSRAAIKDIGRVLGIELDTVNKITKQFETIAGKVESIKEGLEKESLKWTKDDERLQLLFDYAKILENTNRNTGTHAAAVVIAPGNISDYVPLYKPENSAKTQSLEFVTQYEKNCVEEAGLVKMDFLGLTTLSIIENTLKMIKDNTGENIELDNIDFDDKETFNMLSQGKTNSVFQFESNGMQEYLRQLKPQNLEELTAMNALYRPGPMDFIDDYIKRKHGEVVVYDHPLLEPILKETYGIMVYQEQVMKIAQVLAGYDLGEADILRRAMGKKDEKTMEKNLSIFIAGCEKNGIDKAKATVIFEKMEKFANYGFNKSHAAAYAYLAYQTAFLKTHYPLDFMASVLTSEMGKQEKLLVYIESVKEKGLPIKPPDVNYSSVDFTVNDDQIVYALNGIKGVGVGASESIVKARKKEGRFTDILHFLKSIDLRLCNHGVLEILIKSGALDSLGQKRKWMLEHLDDYLKEAQEIQQDMKIGQGNLFDMFADTQTETDKIKPGVDVEEFDEIERLQLEKDTIGFYISGHPLLKYSNFIKEKCSHNSKGIKNISINPNPNSKYIPKIAITIVGVIESVKIFKKDDGTQWASVILEDLYGKFEICVYKDQFNEYSQLLIAKKTIYIKGYCRMFQDGKKTIVVETVYDLDQKQKNELSEYHIFIKEIEANIDDLKNFKNDLNQLNGSTLSVYFHIKEGEDEIVIKSMDVKAPRDSEIMDVFRQKYGFIDTIKIM